MIEVIIPKDRIFNLYKHQFKVMYNNAKDKICDTNSFEFIIKNTLFYGFIKDGSIIGAIYFFPDNGKLFLNAYAGRKHLEDNVECVKMSLDWFNCNIYAEAQNRASALCLLRAGFKRIEGNLFGYIKDSLQRFRHVS